MKILIIVPFLVFSLVFHNCKDAYSQGDCAPGYLDVKGKCTLAVGQECDSNGDCISNVCVSEPDASAGFCTISCHVHDDCPSGFFCAYWDDSRCLPGQRPPPCSSDDECGPCQTCNNGMCLQEDGCLLCQDDTACGPCQRCDYGECIDVAGCVICTDDTQCDTCEFCSESKKCQRISGCILCSVQNDCPGCTSCERGACMPIEGCGTDPCFNDLDCPQKTRCLVDRTSGANVCLPAELEMGGDCTRGGPQQCISGICLMDDATGWCSVACEEDDQCPVGFECLPDDDCLWACRHASTPPPSNACESDRDCIDGRVCTPVWNQVSEIWETRCIASLPCSLPAGASCVDTQQRCFSGLCSSDGYCTSVCSADYQCPESFLCTSHEQNLLPNLPEATFRACGPMETAKFGIGQICTGGDEDCTSGMCLSGQQYGPTPMCSLDCVPGQAGCPDGFVCSNVSQDIFACLAAIAGGQCSHDPDCDVNEICTLDDVGLSICSTPNPGGSPPGEACWTSAMCSSGICLPEGVCSSLCKSAQDCWDGAWCNTKRWFRPDGRSVWESLCVPEPGSMSPCRRDADCFVSEVCRPGLNEFHAGLAGRCSTPGPGGAFWQVCENSRQCADGVCLSLGFCSSLCEQDEDCPEGYSCVDQQVEFMGNSYETSACRPSPVGLGQPCPFGDDDCSSGMCFSPPNAPAYCTVSCVSNDDCAQVPDMTCVSDEAGVTCRFP